MLGMMSLVVSALLQASGASACAMSTGYVPFEVSKDAQPQDAPEDALHAPKAELVSITRGVGGVPGSCDGSGILVIGVKPRGGGHYSANDLGIELEVRGDAATSPILPMRFVTIAHDNSRNELLLLWPDTAPSQQHPLQFDLEVRAVTRDYQRGPATIVHVDTRGADVINAEARAKADQEKAQEKAAKAAEKEQRKLAKDQGGD